MTQLKSKLRKQFKHELKLRQEEYDQSIQEISLTWKEQSKLHQQQYILHLQELQSQIAELLDEKQVSIQQIASLETLVANAVQSVDQLERETHDISVDTSDINLSLTSITAATNNNFASSHHPMPSLQEDASAAVNVEADESHHEDQDQDDTDHLHHHHTVNSIDDIDSNSLVSIEEMNQKLKEVSSPSFSRN